MSRDVEVQFSDSVTVRPVAALLEAWRAAQKHNLVLTINKQEINNLLNRADATESRS